MPKGSEIAFIVHFESQIIFVGLFLSFYWVFFPAKLHTIIGSNKSVQTFKDYYYKLFEIIQLSGIFPYAIGIFDK